jgi:hypothetical protein
VGRDTPVLSIFKCNHYCCNFVYRFILHVHVSTQQIYSSMTDVALGNIKLSVYSIVLLGMEFYSLTLSEERINVKLPV